MSADKARALLATLPEGVAPLMLRNNQGVYWDIYGPHARIAQVEFENEAEAYLFVAAPDLRTHLRAALARVDELTAEVERLRLAGMTCTRGAECHITRGRDV